MKLSKRINQAIVELKEQSRIVSDGYGGSQLRWYLSMIYCMIRYGARPMDYVRFEFHIKSARERNRYLTIIRYFHCIRHYGAGKADIRGKLAEYETFKEFIHRDWMKVGESTPVPNIESFVKSHNTVFAKPVNGDQSILLSVGQWSPFRQ